MKVNSVKRVRVPPTKVYDLTVPGTENFCLANGVVVHNSKDCADAVCGAYHTLVTRASSWIDSADDDMPLELAGRVDMDDRMDDERPI